MLSNETTLSPPSFDPHLLPYSGTGAGVPVEGEEEEGRKHRLPQSVTTPRRGPLTLRAGQKEAQRVDNTSQNHKSKGHRMFLLPRKPANRHSLTRFPVAMVQRPLQQIEADLGQLSCAALQDSVHYLMPLPRHKVTLPHLHPMMKYSPLNNGLHGNRIAPPTLHTAECYTHTEGAGTMDVSITYSRHCRERPPPSQLLPPPSLPPKPTTLTGTPSAHTSLPPSRDSARPSLPLGHSTLNPPLLHFPSLNHHHTDSLPRAQSASHHAPQEHSTSSKNTSNNFYPVPSLSGPHNYETVRPRIPLLATPATSLPWSSSLLLPPTPGSSLAPPSLQAVVVHRRKPLTQHTMLRGHRVLT